MTSDCEHPRCNLPGSLHYIGRWLCTPHWYELANKQAGSDDEAETLNKVKLVRVGGEVRPRLMLEAETVQG